MQGIQGTKIALLIDFDNVILGVEDPGFDVELVVNALRSRGIVVMGRAYGDWYRHHRHRRKLMEQGIELVETPVFGPVIKNSADIRIVLDGIDIASSHAHIDTFCLVSGDSDFLPLIKRLQLLGKNVIIIAGNKFTSDLVRRNCNEYLAYENLLAESVGATEDVSVIEGAYALLQRAISTLLERGMDVRSSTVKQMMLQLNPAFSERTFGCNQFKQFLDKATRAGIVRLGVRDGVSGEYAVLLANETEPAANGTHDTRRDAGSRDGAPRDGSSRDSSQRGHRRGERSDRGFDRAPANEAQTSAPATNVGAEEAVGTASSESNGASATPSIEIDHDDNALSIAPVPSTPLSARSGLRRGRLRFTAKSGRSSFTPRNGAGQPGSTEENQEVTTPVIDSIDSATSQEILGDTQTAAEPVAEVTTGQPDAQNSTLVLQDEVASALPDTAASSEASTDAADTDATPQTAAKKRTTRGGRRRKVAPAASEADSPAEAVEAKAAPVTASKKPKAQAGAAEDAPQADTGTAGDAAAEAIAAETAAPKKPSRSRRGGTKRTPARAPKEAS